MPSKKGKFSTAEVVAQLAREAVSSATKRRAPKAGEGALAKRRAKVIESNVNAALRGRQSTDSNN